MIIEYLNRLLYTIVSLFSQYPACTSSYSACAQHDRGIYIIIIICNSSMMLPRQKIMFSNMKFRYTLYTYIRYVTLGMCIFKARMTRQYLLTWHMTDLKQKAKINQYCTKFISIAQIWFVYSLDWRISCIICICRERALLLLYW